METISPTGLYSEIDFSVEAVEQNLLRLTNQLWKLIPMREHAEDWNKQLNTVSLEIAGFGSIFKSIPAFLQILAKLEGLKIQEIEFELYRKTVFECITLLQGIRKNEYK